MTSILRIQKRYISIFLFIWPSLLWGQEIKHDTIKTVIVNAHSAHKNVKSSAPVQLLSQKDLLQQGITDIADALRRFAGINIKDYGGAGGMKTVSVRSLGSQHTAVTYDGIAVTDCQSGQVDLSRFTLDHLQSLTLVVGDNDDIFLPARSVASAASIRLQTQFPDLKEQNHRLKVEIKTGSFGLFNPLLRYDQQLNKNLSMSFSGDFMRADNLYPFTLKNGDYTTKERRNNNYIETWRGEWNVYAKPGKRSTLNGKIYYYDSFRELPGQVILYNNFNQEESTDRNFFSQLHFRTYWNQGLSLQFNGKFNWAYTHYHDEAPEYPNGEMNNTYYQREYYGSATLLYIPQEKWAFSYAMDYAYNNLNTNATVGVKPYRNTILQSLTSRYRSAHLTVTATLLGSIYLNESKVGQAVKDAKRFSPSLSLSWKPFTLQELYLRASYKDIFRVATFTENYFTSWGSRDLNPETTHQYNIGLTYEKNNSGCFSHLRGSIDGYYNHVKNKIVAMPYNMLFWAMVNLGRVDIYGIDVTGNTLLSLSPDHQLSATLSYTYQHAIDKTDPASSHYEDQIPYTPKHSGALSLNWENKWLNFSFHATGSDKRYSSTQNMKANEIEGYIECGLTFYRSFQWQRSHWTWRGDIVNLGNKQYQIVKNYPMPGRSYKLTLSVTL